MSKNEMFEIELDEPEFEMSDDVKLQELGYDSNFLWDRPIFKVDGNVRLDYFKAYVDWCPDLDTLKKIDYLKLDDKQKEYWSDKKKMIEVVEKIELTNTPFDTDKVQVLVETKDNELKDINLIDMYIEKNGKLQTIVNKRDNHIAELNQDIFDLQALSKELATIFGKHGIKEDLTPEAEKTLEGLF